MRQFLESRQSTADRTPWIDDLKGFAILCVMWGHVQIAESNIKIWLTAFHVHIFLVVSGYLYAKKRRNYYSLHGIVKKSAWPYFVFSVLAIIVDLTWASFVSKEKALMGRLFLDIYKTISLYGIYALWYLPSYCIASILFIVLINSSIKISSKTLIIFLMLLLCILTSYYIKRKDAAVCVGGADINYSSAICYMLISVARPLACVYFIAIGYWIYNIRLLDCNKLVLCSACVGLLIISFFFVMLTGKHSFSTLKLGDNPFALILGASAGASAFFLLFYVLNFDVPVLQFFGRNSLILLITHMSLNLTNISIKIASSFVPLDSQVLGLMALAVMIVIEIPIIYLLNGPLLFLIKKPSCFLS